MKIYDTMKTVVCGLNEAVILTKIKGKEITDLIVDIDWNNLFKDKDVFINTTVFYRLKEIAEGLVSVKAKCGGKKKQTKR